MNFKKNVTGIIVFVCLAALLVREASATELFIHHPGLNRTNLAGDRKIILHGELFFYLLSPSTFPSYNDLSGAVDRWNFGFQDYFPITRTTTVMAQFMAHDDGGLRTKFDWHFHLRQSLFENLVVIIGHDSDHDSDHVSQVGGKPYFTNRNYFGIGIPVEGRHFYIEPFTYFFHNTNQRAHLDLSGERLKQEYGIRASLWTDEGISAHLQAFFQTDKVFSLGQAFAGELFFRMKVTDWLQLSLGGSLWVDTKASILGSKKHFSKLMWGIAFPF